MTHTALVVDDNRETADGIVKMLSLLDFQARPVYRPRLAIETMTRGLPQLLVLDVHMQGTAFHGVYWHNNFGVPCSEGCINMRPDEARWLYRWIDPAVPYVLDPPQFIGKGTKIYLHD